MLLASENAKAVTPSMRFPNKQTFFRPNLSGNDPRKMFPKNTPEFNNKKQKKTILNSSIKSTCTALFAHETENLFSKQRLFVSIHSTFAKIVKIRSSQLLEPLWRMAPDTYMKSHVFVVYSALF